jgi:hypothetical protein
MGRLALAAALTGGLALVFLAVMFAFHAAKMSSLFFGTLNDIANAALALLGVSLAVLMFSRFRSQLGVVHSICLILAILGGLLAAWGSFLVISHRSGFTLAGLCTAAGFGLIGIWVFSSSLALGGSGLFTPGLFAFGLLTGLVMVVGLGGLPSLVRGVDAFDHIPLVQRILWSVGSMAWLVLQPIWYYLLSRFFARPG